MIKPFCFLHTLFHNSYYLLDNLGMFIDKRIVKDVEMKSLHEIHELQTSRYE